MAQWRHERLKYPIQLLQAEHRAAVERVVSQHCEHRSWRRWTVSCRTNHVHAVVTATEKSGKQVRDQLKANATRAVRVTWPEFRDRPVWTVGGDWECLNSDEDLDTVCTYVRDAQDRMDQK